MTLPRRRRWERFRKVFPVTVSRDTSTAIACSTLDVCEGGIGIVCPRALEAGEEYGFDVPALSATPIAGTVRWCTRAPDGGMHHIGVEFSRITAAQVEDVRSAVERWKSELPEPSDG